MSEKDEKKKLLDEVSEEVSKQVAPAITKDVVQKVLDQLPNRSNTKDDHEDKQKSCDYFKALRAGDKDRMKALGTGVSTEGEELAPSYFSNRLQHFLEDVGVVRQLAQRWPMVGKDLAIPTMGSIQSYRIGEMEKITADQPDTGAVKLVAEKVAVIVPISNELLADSNVDVVNAIAKIAATSMARIEDTWGIIGMNADEGIFGHADTNFASTTGGMATVDFNVLLDLVGSIHSISARNAKWVMSWNVYNLLRKIQSTDEHYLYKMPSEGSVSTIWDLPVKFTDVMPTVTDDAVDLDFIALGDFNNMYFGDRKQYTVDVSKEATITDTNGSTVIDLFAQDMSAIRVIERIDIKLNNVAQAFGKVATAA